jgi:hypothetical protein
VALIEYSRGPTRYGEVVLTVWDTLVRIRSESMSHFSNTHLEPRVKLRGTLSRRITMRTITLLVMTLLICLGAVVALTVPESSLQEQIVAKEREELDALKTGNVAAFANLLADEAVFLNSHGASSKAEVVQHIADLKLLDYSMEDVRFVPVAQKTGLIVYKLTQKGASNGKEFTGRANVSALWTEREGKWVCLFSQETPTR